MFPPKGEPPCVTLVINGRQTHLVNASKPVPRLGPEAVTLGLSVVKGAREPVISASKILQLYRVDTVLFVADSIASL